LAVGLDKNRVNPLEVRTKEATSPASPASNTATQKKVIPASTTSHKQNLTKKVAIRTELLDLCLGLNPEETKPRLGANS